MSHIIAEKLALKGDRVLLIDVSDVVDQVGSLYIPEQAQDRQRYRQWEVYATGPDLTDLRLQKGVRVICDSRFAGEPMLWNGTLVRFVREEHVIAIVEEA